MGLQPFHTFDVWVSFGSSSLYDLVNDQMDVWLTNETPDPANHEGHDPKVPAAKNLEQIPFGFGYEGPIDIQQTNAFVGPIFTLSGEPILITAKGGSIGPFRFVVLEDADLIIGGAPVVIAFWDHGEETTILDGGSFEILWQGQPTTAAVLSVF